MVLQLLKLGQGPAVTTGAFTPKSGLEWDGAWPNGQGRAEDSGGEVLRDCSGRSESGVWHNLHVLKKWSEIDKRKCSNDKGKALLVGK